MIEIKKKKQTVSVHLFEIRAGLKSGGFLKNFGLYLLSYQGKFIK